MCLESRDLPFWWFNVIPNEMFDLDVHRQMNEHINFPESNRANKTDGRKIKKEFWRFTASFGKPAARTIPKSKNQRRKLNWKSTPGDELSPGYFTRFKK